MTNALEWLDRTLANFTLGGCVLYVRHTTRESGRTMIEHIVQALQPKDQALAAEFGGRLKGRLGEMMTAPGGRLVETANWILSGAGFTSKEPVIDTDTGDSSAYIGDGKAAIIGHWATSSSDRNTPKSCTAGQSKSQTCSPQYSSESHQLDAAGPDLRFGRAKHSNLGDGGGGAGPGRFCRLLNVARRRGLPPKRRWRGLAVNGTRSRRSIL